MEEICMWYFTRAAKLRQIQRKARAAFRAEFDDAMMKAQMFIHPKIPTPEKLSDSESAKSIVSRSKNGSRARLADSQSSQSLSKSSKKGLSRSGSRAKNR